MKMTNMHNLAVYKFWAPIYDSTVKPGRQRALDILALKPNEKVLIEGAGTGDDFHLLPDGIEATAIDISPDMLAKARIKLAKSRARITLIQGDAQTLLVPEESYDAAILNLILSVIPDGRACLEATLQAIKPGGRLVIFDKFQPDDKKVTIMRKFLNYFSTIFGTDITRRFGDLYIDKTCQVILNDPNIMGGMYRVILLYKNQW